MAIYFGVIVKSQKPTIGIEPDRGNLRTCLSQSLDQAITAAFEHGGTAPDPSNSVTVTLPGDLGPAPTNIRFGIKQDDLLTGPNYEPGRVQSGVLALQPLCLLQGPNKPTPGTPNGNDCLPGTYQRDQPDDQVLQYTLALLTSANANVCGLNDPVLITLGADDVTATAGNISVHSDARIKRLYNAAFALALADTRDPLFDKTKVTVLPGCFEPGTQNNCLMPGMVISSVSTTDQDGKPVDILTVTDTQRKVAGRPLSMRFAVQNRPPVITSITLPATPTVNIEPATYPATDFTLSQGNSLTLQLTAADADEHDTITLSCSSNQLDVSCPATISPGVPATLTVTDVAGTAGSTDSLAIGVEDSNHITTHAFLHITLA
jgi:hypothetical protein